MIVSEFILPSPEGSADLYRFRIRRLLLPSAVLFHICFGGFHHDRALHSLPFQLAADLIDVINTAMEIIGIRGAAPAAVITGKTLSAFGPGIDIAALELVCNIAARDAFVHISQQELPVPDKLMAGIQVPPGGNREILRPAAAPAQPLVDTGASGQVNHEMEEGKWNQCHSQQ